MSWPTKAAVTSVVLLVPGIAAPQAAARPATITGKAPASAKVAGHSLGTALAVGAATSRVLAAERVGRRGTYKLRVAPGPVVVLTPVVSRSGKVKVASSRVTQMKSGRRKRVPVTKKRPRPRRRAGAAQAGRTEVKYSVYGSTVSGDAGALSGKGVDAMLVTDAWEAGQRAPCRVTQFADRKSDAFKAMKAEVALQNSPAFDPRTRITPKWNLPQNTPNTRMNMQVKVAGDNATATITATGKGRTVSRQVAGTVGDLWFSAPPTAVTRALEEIFEELCRPGGLQTIAGTFTGESTMPWGEHWTWNGSAVFNRQGPAEIPGANGNYLLSSGLVTYIASGRFPYAACQMSGNQQFNIQNGSMGVFGSFPQGLEPYTYGIDIGPQYPGTMEVTVSSCEPGAESLEGTRQTVSVGGAPLDPRETYVSDDGLVYDGTESRNESGWVTTYTWSLRGKED